MQIFRCGFLPRSQALIILHGRLWVVRAQGHRNLKISLCRLLLCSTGVYLLIMIIPIYIVVCSVRYCLDSIIHHDLSHITHRF